MPQPQQEYFPDWKWLMRRWRPPAAYEVWLYFADRPPQQLWLTPSVTAPADRPVTCYFGAGPTGLRTDKVVAADFSQLPEDVHVQIVLRENEMGTQQFGSPSHTLN